jgi:hypothetical protein
MSNTESNKEFLRKAYRRWNDSKGGSVDDWMAMADDNISFGSLSEGADALPFTAPIKRKEALRVAWRG